MGKCSAYFHLITSAIGVILGISAFIFFFCIYNNITAGTWALFSGVFATICLKLNILYIADRLETYHSPRTLHTLQSLGFCVFVTAIAFMVWYIFSTMYWHIPVVPIKESTVIAAVWAFMTAKWGLILFITCRRYSDILMNYTPLLQ